MHDEFENQSCILFAFFAKIKLKALVLESDEKTSKAVFLTEIRFGDFVLKKLLKKYKTKTYSKNQSQESLLMAI